MLECRAGSSRDNRSIIEQIQKTSPVTCKNDLLFGTLNCSGKLGSISFLELLTSLLDISLVTF